MNHDKDLDKQLNTTLLRFFDGQLSLSQTRERIKQLTGRSFLDIAGKPYSHRSEPSWICEDRASR
jgi:hypothetical protein